MPCCHATVRAVSGLFPTRCHNRLKQAGRGDRRARKEEQRDMAFDFLRRGKAGTSHVLE